MCSSTNAWVSLEGSIHTEMRSLQAQSVGHRHSRRVRVRRNRGSEIGIDTDSLRGMIVSIVRTICTRSCCRLDRFVTVSLRHAKGQVSSGLADRWAYSRTMIREVLESSSEPKQIGLIRSREVNVTVDARDHRRSRLFRSRQQQHTHAGII